MSTSTTPRPAARRTPILPPQHGAWAFLALPVVLACTVATPTWWTALLTVAWFAAYPASYAGGRLLHDRRPERFRRPFALWVALAAVPAALLLFRFPWLAWVGVPLLVLVAVNVGYARRNDERALANDLVFVGECAAMVAVTWAVAVGGRGWTPPPVDDGRVVALVAVCALVLTGSTLHVKSLIRERRDPRFARASLAWAAGCVPVAVVLAVGWGLPAGWWLVVPFVALLVRSLLLPARGLPPKAVGLWELGLFIVTALCAMLAS